MDMRSVATKESLQMRKLKENQVHVTAPTERHVANKNLTNWRNRRHWQLRNPTSKLPDELHEQNIDWLIAHRTPFV